MSLTTLMIVARLKGASTSPRTTGKSQAIRKVLKSNPKMKTKDVVSTLAQKGMKVTGNLVYYIKGKMKGRRGRKAERPTAVATRHGNDPVSLIRDVKALAQRMGG